MRFRLMVIAALASVAAATAAIDAGAAARAGKWTGQATSTDTSFKYGKVTFTVRGSTIRNLKIESVTVSGCGGMKTIFVPRLTIKGSKFSGSYKPVPDVDDVIIVRGTISGRSAKGTFSEGPTCVGKGKFTARAR
jgi:nitrous oxidase accessory protein NosD